MQDEGSVINGNGNDDRAQNTEFRVQINLRGADIGSP